MTTFLLATNSTTAQPLADTDDLFVSAGVSLLVSGGPAAASNGGSVQVTNYGTMFSNLETVVLGDPVAASTSLVFNGTGGIITSGGRGDNAAAIAILGYHGIENHGQINGNMYLGSGIKTNSSGTIENFGTISGRTGILNYGGAAFSNTINNHGTIHGTYAAIWVQDSAAVTVVNTGLIDGNIYLGNNTTGVTHSSLDSSEGTILGLIFAGDGNNAISSGRLGNQIYSGAGNDTLSGNGGNDTLYGETGNDVISGDEGNDTVWTLVSDGIDTLNGGAGVDVLHLVRSTATAAMILSIASPAAEQELADGTTVVNFERLEFMGGSGNDRITGGALSDTLSGNAGQDTLVGGLGRDFLDGGAGADSYVVDRQQDLVIETVASTAATERDTVTFVGTSGSYALTDNVENLVLGGSAALTGFGNAGANQITGNAAANFIDGLAGVDTLSGMGGSDVYFVDRATDVVIETLSGTAGGYDYVVFSGTSGTFTLGSNIEEINLTGTAALGATGNTLANTILGNSGSNVLSGGLGNDTLTGALGADFFVFNTAPNATTNKDTITDFNAAADTIRLENAIFTALGAATGTLNATLFKNVSLAAVDANDRILYNDGTGTVSYDIDGSGAAAAVVFAVITGAPTLTYADFVVI